MKYTWFQSTLEVRGVRACSIAAWLRLIRGTGYMYTLDHETTSEALKKECGVDQGDPAALKHFFAGLNEAVAGVVRSWQEQKRGVQLDSGQAITHLTFADNVWTNSDSMEDTRLTMLELDVCLHLAGWRLKLKEITWSNTPHCVEVSTDSVIDFGGGAGAMSVRNSGLGVLGSF